MPSENTIRQHWASHADRLPQFDSSSEVLESDVCMACGSLAKCERAHITPLCTGGTNEADNLHMLCHWCHKASEGLLDDEYWVWLRARSVLDVAIQVAAAQGVNVWHIMQAKE